MEQYRITGKPDFGPWNSEPGDPYGVFLVDLIPQMERLKILACPGDLPEPDRTDWDHVSVSALKMTAKGEPEREFTPTWAHMCQVKAWFWEPEDMVMQFHPPESAYVNYHPHTLHLWLPLLVAFPQPDPKMVGPL